MKTMFPRLAVETYLILVERCGAPADEQSQASFVAYFTRPAPGSEYRFQGALDFGGKFRFPRFVVDCYPEHETPARLATIAATNEKLAALLEQAQYIESGAAARKFVKKNRPSAKCAHMPEKTNIYCQFQNTILGTAEAGKDSENQAWIDAAARMIRQTVQ